MLLEMKGACDTFWERRNVQIFMVGKIEGRRLVGTLRRSSGDDIKMNLRVVLWEGADWIRLSQHRDKWLAVVYGIMNLKAS